MSWRVFSIGKWQASVLESDRDLTLSDDKTKLKFADLPPAPEIPELELKVDGPSSWIADATDTEGYYYKFTLYTKDPTSPAIFLGQLFQTNINGTQIRYDTVLAIPKNQMFDGSVSDFDADEMTLKAPAGRLINTEVKGSIQRTHVAGPRFVFTPKDSNKEVTVPLNFDTVYPSNFYCNNIPDLDQHQLGGRYVSVLTSKQQVLFGHIHWGSDRGEKIYAPGDKTEPFLVIQPPPPPLPYGEAGG